MSDQDIIDIDANNELALPSALYQQDSDDDGFGDGVLAYD
jgi:hypothetical protein